MVKLGPLLAPWWCSAKVSSCGSVTAFVLFGLLRYLTLARSHQIEVKPPPGIMHDSLYHASVRGFGLCCVGGFDSHNQQLHGGE